MHDELLDIVNEHDQVIGQQYRSEISFGEKHVRVINGFLVNDKKQLWIPRRSPHKKLFPLCLDFSVGGFVSAGEHYDQAFERELREELNIELSDVDYRLLAYVSPYLHPVSSFMQIYVIYSNMSPDYNKNDFVEYKWMSIQELEAIIAQEEATKNDLPIIVKLLKNRLSDLAV